MGDYWIAAAWIGLVAIILAVWSLREWVRDMNATADWLDAWLATDDARREEEL